MIAAIHKENKCSELFMSYLLIRNGRIEEDLIDQLFNSTEKRLARLLLLLAKFGKEGKPKPIVGKGQSGKRCRIYDRCNTSRVSHSLAA